MSLATTCPACGTCFRVVQDQLKVSEGWVRCGHCQEVFNALDGLFDLDAPTPVATPSSPDPASLGLDTVALAEGPPDTVPAPSWSDPVETAPAVSTGDDSVPAPSAVTEHDVDTPTPQEGSHWLADEPADAMVEPPVTTDDDGEPLGLTSTLPLAIDSSPNVAEPESAADSQFLPSFLQKEAAAEDADTPPVEPLPPPASLAESTPAGQPGFVRAAERRARWEQPAVRVALGFLALLLGATLLAQSAWQWRDRLAYSWPASRPVLSMLCAELGCTLQAPRRIDALVVDNTVLSRPPGSEGYRLTVTLHNRADHPVAVPHLELALSDVQGAVSVRRVLAPTDFQVDATAAIAPQADVSWSLVFTLADGNGKTGAAAGSTRAAGYTVAAFYP